MYTWQTRLFRKSKTLFKGLLHEQAQVKGRLERLEDKYYMEHKRELRAQHRPGILKDTHVHRAIRLLILQQEMLEYLSKMSVSNGDMRKTVRGKMLNSAMLGYERLLSKKPDRELSGFDYFMFYYLKELGFALASKSPSRIAKGAPSAYRDAKQVALLRSLKDSESDFQIARIINDIGITRFLNLDRSSTIAALSKKYAKSEQGVDLLIRLLRKRYGSYNQRSIPFRPNSRQRN